MPLWATSALVFVFFYIIGAIIGIRANEWPENLFHVRSMAIYALPAFASFTLAYAPRKMAQLWTRIKPWLTNSPTEIQNFEEATPGLLMRSFWVISALLFLSVIVLAFTERRVTTMATFRYMTFASSLFSAYFMGGAMSIAIGLSIFMYRFQRWARFKPGFILDGGKEALRPFNQLVWVTWALLTLPVLLVVVAAFTLGADVRPQVAFHIVDLAPIALGVTAFMAVVVVPEYLASRILLREKHQELAAVRDEIHDLEKLPEEAAGTDILRRMHRHQALVYMEQKIHSFAPTLVDMRLALQIIGAVATIASATYALQRLLSSTTL